MRADSRDGLNCFVMPALVAGMHVFRRREKQKA